MTVISQLLNQTTALVAALSQTRTNGASPLPRFYPLHGPLNIVSLTLPISSKRILIVRVAGASNLGTFRAPTLPSFFTNNVRSVFGT